MLSRADVIAIVHVSRGRADRLHTHTGGDESDRRQQRLHRLPASAVLRHRKYKYAAATIERKQEAICRVAGTNC